MNTAGGKILVGLLVTVVLTLCGVVWEYQIRRPIEENRKHQHIEIEKALARMERRQVYLLEQQFLNHEPLTGPAHIPPELLELVLGDGGGEEGTAP